MDSMDFWRLNDEFSILQILLLSLGYDPSGDMQYVENKAHERRPIGYEPLKMLLMRSAKRGDLKSNLQYAPEYDGHGNECGISDKVCLERTTVMLGDIRAFFKSRGFYPVFFFPSDAVKDEFLDPSHEYYAPKLAAIVQAWKAVTSDPKLLNGKTPKQAVMKWLREHAAQYGFVDDDGKPSEGMLDDLAKVANWRPEGGVARTPTSVNGNPSPEKSIEESMLYKGGEFEEIPF